MLIRFKNHINKALPWLHEAKILIAVSGGTDSVALTHLCHQLNLDIAIAHCNFNLRGEESDADEDFVLHLAERLDIKVFTESFNTTAYAKSNRLSVQMAARELRYQWFKKLAIAENYHYVLTAHHAEDNLETFLINFVRGTGLDGLTGIPEVKDHIVRPLLPFKREDLTGFLKTNNLLWREDSSNASHKYLRNKLRHEVVPILKTINPQLIDSFQNTLQHLNESSDLIEDHIAQFNQRAIAEKNKYSISYKISEFKRVKNTSAYLYHVFKAYGFTAWTDILNLLDAQTGKQVFSETHILLKNRDVLILSERNSTEKLEPIEITQVPAELKTHKGVLTIVEVNELQQNNDALYLDAEAFKFPIVLRPWQHGDVFYPLGMTGKKKISKYLKDIKLSLAEKSNIQVLCCNEEIMCIPNYRLDRRFAATKQTKKIIKLTWHNED